MELWHCDSCHSVTFLRKKGTLIWMNHWCCDKVTWLFCDTCRSIVRFVTPEMNKNSIWKCDSVTAVTVSHFKKYGKLFVIKDWCFENVTWLFCDSCHTCRSSVTLVTTDKWAQKYLEIVTLWQLSQCQTFKYQFCTFFGVETFY